MANLRTLSTWQDSTQTAQEVDADTGNIWETLDGIVDGFFSLLPRLAIGIVVFIVFWLLAKGARRLAERMAKQRDRKSLGDVLGRLLQIVVIVLGFLVAMAIIAPSIKPADLLALLGVGGVAIGFAFKDILQNLLAGILILLRKPFEVGDQIVSGGFEGTVEDISTRATMIKTYDGTRVVIPNADIYSNPVTVKTAYGMIRSQYDVGIGYGDDIETARQAILQTLEGIDEVLGDPGPEALTWELAGSSVNIRARWWSKPERAHVVALRNRVIKAIKEALDEQAVDMPYPTQVVLFHDQTEATDGDRTQQREGWPAGDDPPEPRPIGSASADRGSAGEEQASKGEGHKA